VASSAVRACAVRPDAIEYGGVIDAVDAWRDDRHALQMKLLSKKWSLNLPGFVALRKKTRKTRKKK
jgi:hypothetical protein